MLLCALGVVAAVAFVVGYRGLAWVGAELVHLPGAVAGLFAVLVDAGMIVMGLAAAVKRSQRRPAKLEFAGLIGLVSVSILAQVTHVAAVTETMSVSTAIGASLAAVAPLTMLIAVEVVLRTVLAEPAPKRARRIKPLSERNNALDDVPAAPKRQPTRSPRLPDTETEPLTDGQRAKAVGRFESIPGYRGVLEQHIRTGSPTQREIHALEGTPSRATIGADARVVADELAALAPVA